MAKSSYLPHLLFGAVVCVCVYVASDSVRNKEQGARMKDGSVEHLPATRFFGGTGPVRKAAQNDTLFGIGSVVHRPTARFFGATEPVRLAAQNDTLFQSEKAKVKRQKGVEYLPTTRFFDPAIPIRKAAQKDTLFGVEYLPAARFFDRANRAHRAAQNDTLFGRVEHLPTARFFEPARPVRKAAQNDTLFGKIRSIYTAEIGIREKTGKNDGQRIEEYLSYVGLGKGNPWCAAFICWVYGKAGVVNPRSGWSPALFPEARIIWSRRRGYIKNPLLNIKHSDAIPRRADIFGIWFQDKKRIAHCGFIDDWQEKYVITVEGNTNESGSREGDGVYRKRRLISTVYKVARWVG